MKIRVVEPAGPVREVTAGAAKFSARDQLAVLEVPGKYGMGHVEFLLSLDGNDAGYPVGDYELGPASFGLSRQRLVLERRLDLVPVAARKA